MHLKEAARWAIGCSLSKSINTASVGRGREGRRVRIFEIYIVNEPAFDLYIVCIDIQRTHRQLHEQCTMYNKHRMTKQHNTIQFEVCCENELP